MKRRYVMKGHKLVEVTGKVGPVSPSPARSGPTVITDIQEPFVSPVDGSVITSRADLREHNVRNQVEDVGNDPAFQHPTKPTTEHQSAARELYRLLRESERR